MPTFRAAVQPRRSFQDDPDTCTQASLMIRVTERCTVPGPLLADSKPVEGFSLLSVSAREFESEGESEARGP